MGEAPPAYHGDADSRDSLGGRMSEARGREDRGDQKGCFVADLAGGVLGDGEGVEGFGVGDLTGEAHGLGECGQLSRVEAAEKDGHQEGGYLGVGHVLSCGGAVDDGEDEGADLGVGEGEAVAFVEDDVDGMDAVGHVFRLRCSSDLIWSLDWTDVGVQNVLAVRWKSIFLRIAATRPLLRSK